jgi:hypothetical protein
MQMLSYTFIYFIFRMSKEDFKFTFLSKDLVSTLEVPVPIPLKQPLNDFISQLVTTHNLPCFVEDG